MSGRIYIGLDQGTTGVTALAFDEQWQAVGRGYREIGQHYPQLGWVEHDAEEILASAQYAVKAALAAAGAQPGQVRALGLDHEGESVVVWERSSGRPVYPAIVWQDRRTAAMAEELEEKHGALFRERTGLTPDAYFSATKLKWILDRVDPDRSRAKSGQLLAGNMDAWLMWNMTGGEEHRTDASTASRTMLYNIRTGTWDRDLLELLDIPERLLPEIGDSAGRWSTIRPEGFAGLSCPVCAAMADQQAAMVGQICLASMAAFSFSHFEYKGKQAIFMALLATMMIPTESLIISNYLTIGDLGLYDTYLAMILPSLASAMSIFFMRQAFMQVPRALYEVARMEGCGNLRYLFTMLLPLSKGSIGAICIYTFINAWNSYLWPLLVTNQTSMRTVQIGVGMLYDREAASYNMIMAGITIVLIPSVLVFVVGQKQILSGTLSGAIKG